MEPKITETDFYLEVTDLINKGDDLDKWVDEDHGTLLHFAAVNGFAGTVSLLLESGASVDPVTFDNDTPLNMAAHFGHTEAVEILLKNGANVNFLSDDGITPLLDTCMLGNIETVKAILNYNPDINQTNNKGQNALTVALIHNRDEVANYLLQTDINVDAFDMIRRTPLSYATLFGSSSCVEELCKNGANVLTQDVLGKTPLHNAVESGNIETIQILMSYGANLGAENLIGETPLSKALSLYKEQIVDYLCSNLSKGTFKNLAVNDPCPCASGKKYKKCCLNVNPEDILMKFSSVHPPKYDSINSLLEDQIKKADWTYKSKEEFVFLGMTPNYFRSYPWYSDVIIAPWEGRPPEEQMVVFITKYKMPKPHNHVDSVKEMADICMQILSLTRTVVYYKEGGFLGFGTETTIDRLQNAKVTLPNLIIQNTGYLIRTMKAFNSLMATGLTLVSDWETLVDEFSPDVKTSRLLKEKINTAFGQA